MTETPISVRLIANAGILVEYRGLRFLIDGIHTNDNLDFDGVPEQLLGTMLRGDGALSHLDYLLFTHEHIDHFSPSCTQIYLQNNRVKGIFMPASGGRRLADLQEYTELAGIPCHRLQLVSGTTKSFPLTADTTVTAAGFRHMGDQFREKENDCFLLSLGDQNLLFTGDADLDLGHFQSAFAGKSIELMLVNPLFYLDKRAAAIFAALSPRQVAVYHLPVETNGPTVYQRAVLRDAQRNAPLPYKLTLFTQFDQTIVLS